MNPVFAQEETEKEKKAREKQEQKDKEKSEKKKGKDAEKQVSKDRKLFKIRGDSYMMAGDEINALRYYDSAIAHIDEEEADEIKTAIKKKKDRKYPDDYLEIIQKKGIIHLSKGSYILADSLLSARAKVIGKQEGDKDSDYANALADLSEVYIEQGNIKKADSILDYAQPYAEKAASRQKIGEGLLAGLQTLVIMQIQNGFADLGLSDASRNQLIGFTSTLMTAQRVLGVVKGAANPYLSKFNKTQFLRRDAVGRHVYLLGLSNRVKMQLGDFSAAEDRLKLAANAHAKRFFEKDKVPQMKTVAGLERTGGASFWGQTNNIFVDANDMVKSANRTIQLFGAVKANMADAKFKRNAPFYTKERNTIFNDYGNYYIRRGEFYKADSLFNYSMQVTPEILKSREASDVLLTAYESYLSQEYYDKAEEWLRYAVTVYKEYLGADHPAYVNSLIAYGQLRQIQEQYEEAETIYKIVEDILAKNDKQLAEIEKMPAEKRASQKALIDYDAKISAKSALRLSLLSVTADLYLVKAQYAKAEENAKDLVGRYRNANLERSRPYTSALLQLTRAYEGLGDAAKANEYRKERRELMRVLLGENNVEFSLAILKETPINTEENKKAILQALGNIKKQKGENSITYANALAIAAESFSKGKDFDTAESYYGQYISTIKATLGAKSNAYAEALYKYGTYLLEHRKVYDRAMPLFRQSGEIFTKNFGEYHPNTIDVIGSMADLYAATAKTDSAEIAYRVEVERILYRVNKEFSSMGESEREKFLTKMNRRLNTFQNFSINLLAKKPDLSGLLYDEVLSTKALLFKTTNKLREVILNSDDEALKQNFKNLIGLKEAHAKALLKTPEELKRDDIKIDEMEEQIRNLERKLSTNTLYAQSVKETRYNWQQVREKLKVGEAAVEIIRIAGVTADAAPNYIALVVKPNAAKQKYPDFVKFPNKENGMEKGLLSAARAFQSKKGTTGKDASYATFWKPLADKLTGIKKIYLSLDGVYNQININAIKNPATGTYVLDEKDLHFISCTRDLTDNPEITQNKKDEFDDWTVTLLGFPDYDAGSDTTEKVFKHVKTPELHPDAGTRFFTLPVADLPNTEKEVQDINRTFTDKYSTVKIDAYTKDKATETVVKEINNPKILHIATHGFFVTDMRKTDMSMADEKTLMENPLLRSGLLLAGAENTYAKRQNDAAEDGILTAYEAMNLKLDKTEIVVMSACETGRGEIKNGEGVYGLQRAFQTAGAKSILMSLWKVDDEATKTLMISFYKNWIATGNRHTALKNAQLELKRSKAFSHPFYWGAFVMVGK